MACAGGDANIVPVEANGLVYVASYRMLTIFGPGGSRVAHLPPIHLLDITQAACAGGTSNVRHSAQRESEGNRHYQSSGEALRIDATDAEKTLHFAQPAVGHALIARGKFEKSGVLQASAILHAKDSPALWQADR